MPPEDLKLIKQALKKNDSKELEKLMEIHTNKENNETLLHTAVRHRLKKNFFL